MRRAAAEFPDVELTEDDFVVFVEEHVDDAGALSEEALAELYLACGCSRGDKAALAHLDARYLASVPAALAHMRLPAETIDEVRQLVRHKLLVAEPGKAPKLEGYAGRGKQQIEADGQAAVHEGGNVRNVTHQKSNQTGDKRSSAVVGEE